MSSAPPASTLAAIVSQDDMAEPSREAGTVARQAEPADSPSFLTSLLGPGVLSVVDQGVVSAANFLTNLALGRALLPSELGSYYLAWSLFFFLRGVQEQTLCAPYMVFVHKRDEIDQARYTGSCLTHQFAFCAAVAAILALVGMVASNGFGIAGFGPMAWILAGAAPLMLLREFVRQIAFAHLEVGQALALDATVALVQVAGIGSLVVLQVVNPASALVVLAVACGVGAVGWFLLRPRPLAFESAAIQEHWHENWSFGRWTLAGQLLGSATPYLLPWFLALVVGVAETGEFAACATLVGMANLFVVGLSNYLSHRAIHSYRDGGTTAPRSTLQRVAAIYLLALGAFLVATLFFGEWAVDLAFRGKYAGGGTVLTILSAGMLANSLGITAGNGLWALERPEANLAADLVALTVTCIVAWLAIAPWGAVGAAWASCAGMTAGAIVRWSTLELLLRETERGAAQP